MRVRSFAVLGLAALVLPSITRAQSRTVPTPASVIGFEPGTDRKLPEWQQVFAYFKALDAASPRVQLRVLGKTTLGRPFIAAFISDADNLANLPKIHEAQRKLADPRMTTPQERAALERDGKVVVLVTSSIHSTEVGGILTPLTLAYRLATSEGAEAKAIRKNTVVILVPSLNPDGVDIVGNWYKSSLGTPGEGSQPPTLYHYY